MPSSLQKKKNLGLNETTVKNGILSLVLSSRLVMFKLMLSTG